VEVSWRMGTVSIHFEDELVSPLYTYLEAFSVCGPKTKLLRSMENANSVVSTGELVGEVASTVRGAVINNEDIMLLSQNLGHDGL
jgi:hypothetical protein